MRGKGFFPNIRGRRGGGAGRSSGSRKRHKTACFGCSSGGGGRCAGGKGEEIVLTDRAETSYGFSNNTLTILNGARVVAALSFAPGEAAGGFVVTNEAGVGVVITHG